MESMDGATNSTGSEHTINFYDDICNHEEESNAIFAYVELESVCEVRMNISDFGCLKNKHDNSMLEMG